MSKPQLYVGSKVLYSAQMIYIDMGATWVLYTLSCAYKYVLIDFNARADLHEGGIEGSKIGYSSPEGVGEEKYPTP